MRAYLDAMDSAAFVSPLPGETAARTRAPRVLAALRPRMLRPAGRAGRRCPALYDDAGGNSPGARILGPDALLLPEQAFVLETDPAVARRIGRNYLAWYLGVENYQRSLDWQGFGEEDVAGGGSARLVDAIVAWGDEEAVRRRVQEHFDAGATHVSVQAITDDPLSVELDAYRRVAPALLAT